MRPFCGTIEYGDGYRRKGVVLLLTIVILSVLTAMVYTLTWQISRHRHRQQYMIDYQKSRYACDSAVKYAIATIEDIELNLIEREKYPDFSDLFFLTRRERNEMIEEWLIEQIEIIEMEEGVFEEEEEPEQENVPNERQAGKDTLYDGNNNEYDGGYEDEYEPDIRSLMREKFPWAFEKSEVSSWDMNTGAGGGFASLFSGMFGGGDTSEPNEFEGTNGFGQDEDYIDPNEVKVPGPYGPDWPFVQETIELEIEGAEVTIEIEDENAKMPLAWAIMKDKEKSKLSEIALERFGEWMMMDEGDLEDLKEQLKILADIKEFDIDAKDITITETKKQEDKKRSSRTRRTNRRSRRKRTVRRRSTAAKKKRPVQANMTDFAKLLHSTAVDSPYISVPSKESYNDEAAVKYLGLWGSRKVNVNTAPRHVLEAAFSFGGNHVEVADRVIQERKVKPFESIDDLEQRMLGMNDYIRKAKPYLTAESEMFSVTVKAVSGNAESKTVVTMLKKGKKVEKLSVMPN
jgi:hypothetical protein